MTYLCMEELLYRDDCKGLCIDSSSCSCSLKIPAELAFSSKAHIRDTRVPVQVEIVILGLANATESKRCLLRLSDPDSWSKHSVIIY